MTIADDLETRILVVAKLEQNSRELAREHLADAERHGAYREALQEALAMIAKKDEPAPPKRRGRPPRTTNSGATPSLPKIPIVEWEPENV